MRPVHNPVTERPCSCRAWGSLGRLSRDLLLDDLMAWAKLLHQVQLTLLLRGEQIAICELRALRSDRREANRLLTELCSWADCAHVVLELTPPERRDFGVQRLTRLCISVGFEPNRGFQRTRLLHESMIRYPIPGRCHMRL